MKRANVNQIIFSGMEASKVDPNVAFLLSDDEKAQSTGMQFFRKCLAIPKPDVYKFLQLKILPRIIELMLKRDADNDFSMDAVWILTNIASSNKKHGSDEIIKANGLQALHTLFDKSKDSEVKAQCLWTLSNISQDSQENRNQIIATGIFPKIIDFYYLVGFDIANSDLLLTVVWTLANLHSVKYSPLNYAQSSHALTVFKTMFFHVNDSIKLEALKGLCAISEQKKFVALLVNLIPDLVSIIDGSNKLQMKEALRIVGNIAYTNEGGHLMESNLIVSLKKLLNSKEEYFLKECTWIVSNIAADGFINELLEADIYPRIIELLTHKNNKVRRESIYVINNSTKNGNCEQIKQLVIMDVIRALTKLIDEKEHAEIILTSCESIFNILDRGHFSFCEPPRVNLYGILVDKYGGNSC